MENDIEIVGVFLFIFATVVNARFMNGNRVMDESSMNPKLEKILGLGVVDLKLGIALEKDFGSAVVSERIVRSRNQLGFASKFGRPDTSAFAVTISL